MGVIIVKLSSYKECGWSIIKNSRYLIKLTDSKPSQNESRNCVNQPKVNFNDFI